VQLLIIKEPGSIDRVFDLFGEDVLIGRSRGCDLRLANVSVSREHARLRWESGNYILENNGSHNGIYVNGKRVETQELGTGDEIRLGKYELVYIHERVPRVLQSADIDAMPRWHQVTIGTADDSTYRLSEAMMERMIASSRLMEFGTLVLEGAENQRWTPGERTLVMGRGAEVPVSGRWIGKHVAELLWNGRSHVLRRTSRIVKVQINGEPYKGATMLEHGDLIAVGKVGFRYVVSG